MNAHRKRPDDARVDRGADGPAMAARPFVMVTIEADTEAEDGTSRFTRSEVRRIVDGPIHWYVERGVLLGWSVDAAWRLSDLYRDGNHAPTGYRVSGAQGGGEMSDERAEAWAALCAAIDSLPHRCRETCMDLARGSFPTRINAVSEMQDGFKALVKYWKLGPQRPA
jgi:hypothetical protein